MDKFWKWMGMKGYLSEYYVKNILFDENSDKLKVSVEPTKQMLIGYMIEYIMELVGTYDIYKNVDSMYKELQQQIRRLG